MKTYEDAVKLLTSQSKFRIELGLERIEKILKLLGNPQDKLKCIHVAGTNGKGSVCAIISTILAKVGYKTGLYTSPHIFDYTERIKILEGRRSGGIEVRQFNNSSLSEISQEQQTDYGLFAYSPIRLLSDTVLSPYRPIALSHSPISNSDFTKYIFAICDLADKNGINLTEFEILTAVMFKYFADNEVDIVVLETGLGGRFDATNVIKSNLCAIITHIDLDHTERLGNTKSEIAYEKAGIIKPNCPVFTCEGYEEIKDKADECNSLLTIVTPLEDTANLSLKGTCQQENLSLVLSAVRYLFPEISENTIQEALKEVKHPCRFQIVRDDLIIDASHNPNGAMALRKSLDLYYPKMIEDMRSGSQEGKPVSEDWRSGGIEVRQFNNSEIDEIAQNQQTDTVLLPYRPIDLSPNNSYTSKCYVFGCLRNKDYKQMMKILFDKDDEIYFYHFKHPNSCTIEELQRVCKFPSKPFKSLEELPKDKLKIVCGSFYMLNEIIAPELVLQ